MKRRTRTGKYIDPTTDYGFKRIFGKDASKELLISLLNGLFRGRKAINSLEYNRNEHVGNTKDTGAVIFDLTCTAENGEKFAIEVQRSRHANLKNRMLYYGSKLIADQAPDGERELWNYNVTEVYVIVLMDGFPMPGGGNGNVLHDICLCDRDTRDVFHEKLGFIYVELENFTKQEDEIAGADDLDKWLYVLKNMSEMDAIPKYLRKTIFEKVFDIAKYSNLSKEEQKMYDSIFKNKWDEYSIRTTAIMEGKQEGRLEGRLEGIQEGRLEERKKAEEEKLMFALNFKKSGLPTDVIAKNLGLTAEDIERL